ncbi:hypothetical protein [Aureivirga sp. CE67]|uniref:hypothetical protein n=1 Tax=Aureivirga sp. CE67 TaxID=1788983 RepID=UPI0018CA4B43|nr:hypothetical protein [Aureivirga sp. CE67]
MKQTYLSLFACLCINFLFANNIEFDRDSRVDDVLQSEIREFAVQENVVGIFPEKLTELKNTITEKKLEKKREKMVFENNTIVEKNNVGKIAIE